MRPGAMPLQLRIVLGAGLAVVLVLATILAQPTVPITTENSSLPPLVVIDPGHGGYDGGAERDGVLEKDINLEVALALREVLLATGYRVLMTRYGDYSLIGEDDPGDMTRKRADYQRRLAVVEQSQPDVIIMIHCNAIGSSVWYGAQTFFQEGYGGGKLLAEDIQFFLTRFTDTSRQVASGDYYLLRESTRIGSLVEVGFISNPRERTLLQQPEYQRRLALAIMLGISKYIHYPTELDRR
ncbi:MAG: N-acetylmuramoyl-L-alanine amidase CwlD [Firmicutes bacterium]|nr:N-acetylmuramoyl-L-alanine amidase CwlD [Bacillota bacterium]